MGAARLVKSKHSHSLVEVKKRAGKHHRGGSAVSRSSYLALFDDAQFDLAAMD